MTEEEKKQKIHEYGDAYYKAMIALEKLSIACKEVEGCRGKLMDEFYAGFGKDCEAFVRKYAPWQLVKEAGE